MITESLEVSVQCPQVKRSKENEQFIFEQIKAVEHMARNWSDIQWSDNPEIFRNLVI
jgi:hypothetical protein